MTPIDDYTRENRLRWFRYVYRSSLNVVGMRSDMVTVKCIALKGEVVR